MPDPGAASPRFSHLDDLEGEMLPRSFPADPEGYERFFIERGARQLPNPPIDMPDWIQDTRS